MRLLSRGQGPEAPVQVFITRDAQHCGLEVEGAEGGRECLDVVNPGGLRSQLGPSEHPSLLPSPSHVLLRRLLSRLDLLRDYMADGYTVPFGFDLNQGFGPMMELPTGSDFGGWSCAIFVCRVFEAGGLPLLDLQSYAQADEARVARDVADQQRLLKTSTARDRVRGATLRPAEVAAASASAEAPLDLARAEAAGRELEALLRAQTAHF